MYLLKIEVPINYVTRFLIKFIEILEKTNNKLHGTSCGIGVCVQIEKPNGLTETD